MRRGLLIALASALSIGLFGLACGGTSPSDVVIDDAGPEAGGPVPAAIDAGASSVNDPKVDDASTTPDVAPSPQSTCVPREDWYDGGPNACRGSSECPMGMICCGIDGAETGSCTNAASCAAPTLRQLCSADCECAPGKCANAWPYIVYARCQ